MALNKLHAHFKQRDLQGVNSEYLFCIPNGDCIPPRKLRNEWQKWRTPKRINVSVHELRHTHISYTIKTDETLEQFKTVFGHSEDMDTRRVYMHDVDKAENEKQEFLNKIKNTADKIESIFDKYKSDN